MNASPPGQGLVVAMQAGSEHDVDPQQVREHLSRIIEQLGLVHVDLNVVIIDDPQMADLHQRFSGESGTTDVLTFDLRPKPAAYKTAQADLPRPDASFAGVSIDGEIYVCVDEARRRAADLHHPVEHELLLYATHGLLHLLGYDDHEPHQHRLMHEKEDQLLTAIGIGAVFGREGGDRP